MNSNLLLGAKDRPKTSRLILLSFQHVFAMFGATVLVPMLTGLSISVALFASGVGTLLYILCTKAKVPIYLGSSFAYIAYINTAISATNGGVGAALTGIVIVGIIYCIVALIIKFAGTNWLNKLLPPVIIGPMIIVIGLGLSTTAIQNTGLMAITDANLATNNFAGDWRSIVVAFATMLIIALVAIKAKGFFKVIPFLIGIIAGYIIAILIGFIPNSVTILKDGETITHTYGYLVDLNAIKEILMTPSKWFKIPDFKFLGWKNQELGLGIEMVKINFAAAISVIPLTFATICEHIGDHKVLGKITGTDYLVDPGLDRTLLGDGVATLTAGLIGGPANTSYGENTSVVGITKVGSVWVTGGAAIIAILLSFVNVFAVIIKTIPNCVIGGICLILYGFIASNGLKTLQDAKVDLTKTRNLIIVSVMLVIGIGGAIISFGSFSLTGMALTAIIGIILNLILPKNESTNDVNSLKSNKN